MLAHESRPLRPWLIFDVRRKMNRPFFMILAFVAFPLAVTATEVAAEFGVRIDYRDHELVYGNFSVRFVKREEHRPSGMNLRAVRYVFEVLDSKKKRAAELVFTASGLVVGTCPFTAEGKTYVAEALYSTAPEPVPPVPHETRAEMREEEIVVWDEETARRSNPELLKHWKEEANQRPEPMTVPRTAIAHH